MKRFIGKFEDLKEVKNVSYNGKIRYFCPYCDTIHGRAKDKSGCVVFDKRSMSGYCFRCNTFITHDGLQDLEYIKAKILKQKQIADSKKENKLLKIDWLTPIWENKEALEYMYRRFIVDETMERFNIKACSLPDGVVFINKVIEDNYTDFMQARFINDNNFKHVFLEDLVKKLCWLHLADDNNLIICEGFTDGLSAYQHSEGRLHPIILGGKTITDLQIEQLREFCSKYKDVNIIVCMDGGFFEDTLKVANKIYQSCYNTKVKVMSMPFNKDLNEISSTKFKELYSKILDFEPSKVQYIREQVYKKS